MSARQAGHAFENLATEYLLKQDLQLIQRNFQCRLGEIDAIFKDNETLIFVEVRFRKNDYFGSPAATVDFRKQQKLLRCAKIFLKLTPNWLRYPCRFDVIAITLKHYQPSIEWIKNAF